MKKALVTALMKFFAALPLKVQYANGRIIEWLLRDVVRYRRNVVHDNIVKAFPDKSAQELKQIEKGYYRHLGRVIVEAIWFGGCRSDEKLKRSGLVNVTNPEFFHEIYSKGRSVVVLYTHNCNWELLGALSTFVKEINPDSAVVVYKRLSDPLWDEIFARNRRPVAHKDDILPGYVESANIVRYMFSHSAEQKVYFINTDQFPYGSALRNVPVKFMGRDTVSMTAAAAVASKFALPVLNLSMLEKDGGGYEYTFTTITEDASRETAQFIMDQYYRLLEEDIKKKPQNYLWSHRRWKNPEYAAPPKINKQNENKS